MGGRCNELIGGTPQFGTASIHGIRSILWRLARHVLLDRIAEQLAPRFLRSPREPLGSFKDIFWNGNGGLHTIILVRFQDETNDPGPSGETSQRLGICRHPREASFKLTDDCLH